MLRILAVLLLLGTTTAAFGQSQAYMSSDAINDYKKVDKELNTVYQQILSQYKTNNTFIANIKAAQKLWVQWRDAEVKARYPDGVDYGSIYPMCRASFLTALTEDRVKQLKVWTTGIEEGDVCIGSVKTKN